MFFKIGILKRFTKFTGKHLCQSLFFNKVTDLRPATLLKKRLWHKCFPVNLAKFLRTLFSLEYLRWLLLCNSAEYELLRNILHRFLLLVPESLLCVTVPFQGNPFKLSIRLAIFWNSYFSELLLFRTATKYRSSYQSCSIKIVVIQNFAIFTGKHLCWSLFLIKLQAFRATILLKIRLKLRCFHVNIAKFLRTSILRNICELLLCFTDFSDQLVFREQLV